MIKILELPRERTGPAGRTGFDIPHVHEVILRDGAVPLAILEELVDAWVEAESCPLAGGQAPRRAT